MVMSNSATRRQRVEASKLCISTIGRWIALLQFRAVHHLHRPWKCLLRESRGLIGRPRQGNLTETTEKVGGWGVTMHYKFCKQNMLFTDEQPTSIV